MKRSMCFIALFLCLVFIKGTAQNTIWKIGNADKASNEFALAPDKFKDFVGNDFGYEDKFFLIGHSKEKADFPYVLPGPVDTWGGTWPTSGWRTNQVNILFGIQNAPANGEYKLQIKLADYSKKFLPLIKVMINGQEEIIQLGASGYDVKKQPTPKLNEPFIDTASITGNLSTATPKTIEIPISRNVIRKGGNTVTITVLQGSWIMFDQVQMNGTNCTLVKPAKLFVRNVEPAKYTLDKDGEEIQPLLVNIEQLSGKSTLRVEVDSEDVFTEVVDIGNYIFEVPMSVVAKPVQSKYRVLVDGKLVEVGTVNRTGQKKQTAADYIDTRMVCKKCNQYFWLLPVTGAQKGIA